MDELILEARLENLERVLSFVREKMEKADFPAKAQFQVEMATEELFVNIAHYAYAPETGTATIQAETTENPRSISVTFIDSGIPYNPLAKEDPDVTLSAEERKIGGLGVYLVKKNMDDVSYEHKNGQNVLRIRKSV